MSRIHHPHSPSKLNFLEACPKYQSAQSESDAATMGTKQHDAAESGLDDVSLPDAKAAAVAECLRFVDERRALYPGGSLLKEEYLPIDDEDTTAGYLDVGIVSADGKQAEVIDFKYGKHAVEPANNNLQGMAYALGLVHKYPTIRGVNVWFVMPHREEVTGHTFFAEDFDDLRLRIKTVVHRAIEANKNPDDFSMATPNQSACLFCSAIGRCPKIAEVALNVGKRYAPLQIPESVSTTVFTDPEQISTGLKLAAIVKVWAEAYRAQATAKTIEDPDFVPEGYKLVTTVKRKVLNAKSLGALAKEFLPESEREKVEWLYEIQIGKLEKLISLCAGRGQKETTVEQFGAAALAAKVVEEGTPFAFLRQS